MVGGREWSAEPLQSWRQARSEGRVLTHSQARVMPPLWPEYDSLTALSKSVFQKPLIFIMLTKYIGETQLKEKLQFLWLIFDNGHDMTIYWKYN